MENNVISLPEILDINYAHTILKLVEEKADFTKNININSKACSKISTSFIQFLISLDITLAVNSSKIVLLESNEYFKKSFTDIGLETYIEKWSV